ncbi:MAG: hypothetical protein V3V97_22615 [Hyphomicrobiaceae bacterium]
MDLGYTPADHLPIEVLLQTLRRVSAELYLRGGLARDMARGIVAEELRGIDPGASLVSAVKTAIGAHPSAHSGHGSLDTKAIRYALVVALGDYHAAENAPCTAAKYDTDQIRNQAKQLDDKIGPCFDNQPALYAKDAPQLGHCPDGATSQPNANEAAV